MLFVAGSCECDNEPPGSIKCGKFLDQPRNCSLLKEPLLHGVNNLFIYLVMLFIVCVFLMCAAAIVGLMVVAPAH
jgi:hypothetical protein